LLSLLAGWLYSWLWYKAFETMGYGRRPITASYWQ
jgi:hypothetical protein